MKKIIFIIKFIFLINLFINTEAVAQNTFFVAGKVINQENGEPIIGTTLFIPNIQKGIATDESGNFKIENLNSGIYDLQLNSLGYQDTTYSIQIIDQSINIELVMIADVTNITTINVTEDRDQEFGIQRLRQVENNAIYSSKKNELIQLSRLTINKATNNSRQVYAKVSGLNIWESDGAGIQLGIGGRGLSPSRNANFNTR